MSIRMLADWLFATLAFAWLGGRGTTTGAETPTTGGWSSS